MKCGSILFDEWPRNLFTDDEYAIDSFISSGHRIPQGEGGYIFPQKGGPHETGLGSMGCATFMNSCSYILRRLYAWQKK